MGCLVEHVVARRTIGNAGRAVGRGPSLLDGIGTQNILRRWDRKEEATSLSLTVVRRLTRPLLGSGIDRRGTPSGLLLCTAALSTSSAASSSFRRQRCFTPEFHREEIAHARPRGRVGRARATPEDESSSPESPTSAPPPPPPPVSDKKAAAKAEVEKGQTTAIITGVISVLLGVGYLVLLQLLDTRGVNLVPPPPEAFDP